ncbi:MAG: response regulator [Candidatus Margulisiibacteriota bacterium]
MLHKHLSTPLDLKAAATISSAVTAAHTAPASAAGSVFISPAILHKDLGVQATQLNLGPKPLRASEAKVVFVDDTRPNHVICKTMLTKNQFLQSNITMFLEPQKLLEDTSIDWSTIHFLVLDQEMPGLTGCQLLNQLRQRSDFQAKMKGLIVICTTDDQNTQLQEEARAAGAAAVLPKDFPCLPKYLMDLYHQPRD